MYFTDHTDPELAEAVRLGRKREFAAHGWSEDEVPDPQEPPPATARSSTAPNANGTRTGGSSPGTASSSRCAAPCPT